ncbi:hypothetical protein THICB3560291 [Thiomonas sp. CB3]|nr:hypothetical protein THICB3560291 [Thiomonas sp. CB3]
MPYVKDYRNGQSVDVNDNSKTSKSPDFNIPQTQYTYRP